MEEMKERKRQQLVRRRIPADLWDYFLENPEHMVMRTRPPDHDQSEKSHQNVVQVPPAYNVQDTEPPATTPGHYQVQSPGTGAAPSREEAEEELREKKKQQLARRKVPTELWDYYLKSPEH